MHYNVLIMPLGSLPCVFECTIIPQDQRLSAEKLAELAAGP
jgi:hypothetical protein